MHYNNCLKNSFYDFCLEKVSQNCYVFLYKKFLEVEGFIKNELQRKILEWKSLLQTLSEKNYIYVAEKIKIEEKQSDENEKAIIFYFYKVFIKNNLNIDIDTKTTFEEVYSYLYLIQNKNESSKTTI